MPQFDSQTTRMPNGLTNASPGQTFGSAGMPDPSFAQLYHNDFNTFAAADWTTTLVGTGTQALTDADGGALLVSNTAGATDATYMKLANAGFKLSAGKPLFFKFAGTLSDLTNTAYFGLVNKAATTAASITDGVFLTKATSGSGALTLNIRVSSVATTIALPTDQAIVAGAPFELGIVVDYLGNVGAYFNPTTGHTSANNLTGRGPVAALYSPSLPSALLTPAFGLLNASAAARTLSVDFLTAARER